MGIDPSAEDRIKAQTQFGKNLVVEAGAGTGKTSSLIRRMCIALLAQGVAIEKMVALTFTEKAAAEIKNRLVNALHQVIRDMQQEQRIQTSVSETNLLHVLRTSFALKDAAILARVQAALAKLDRASVGTIHGFCADVLKTFPLEAGLSPQAEIDAGDKAARLFEARWNTFLDKELGLQAPRAAQWKTVLAEISLEELKVFAQRLCRGQIEQYDYFSHAKMLAKTCEEKSACAQQWARAFLDPKKPAPRKIEQALSWAAQSLLRTAAFLREEPVPITEEPQAPAVPSTLPKGWEEDTWEAARGLVQFASKITPEKQCIFRLALELVFDLTQQIRAEFTREGILSFDDLIVKTRRLVQQDLYVRRLLKEKFDMLFIDEFQDTDPVQGELLLFLAEEKGSSASRWQDVRLEPGKLFVVGDPKQSIYRFRGADITAYELFTQLILEQGGEKCFLRYNFRSAPEIVAVANTVCRRAMVQQTAFQPAYEPIYATKPARPGAVRWLFVEAPESGATADELRDNQAEQMALWIEQNVGKMTLSNGEKLAYKDIAILARAATTSGPYLDALRRHGIAFNTDGEKDFFKRQEINDLLNFLRVLLNPADQTALVGVLRSPLGGVTDEEIYQLARRGALHLSAQAPLERLSPLYNKMLAFSKRVGRTDVKQLIEEVLQETFLPEACCGAYEEEQTLEVLTRLIDLVPQITGDGPATLRQFLAAVERIVQSAPEELNTTPVEALDAVTIMTVHKSKGLEKPVVLLADLSKREASATATAASHLFSWQYNMHGLRVGKICDVNLAFLEEEQKKHERCEEIRILYVALTRAQENLLLVADSRKGAIKAAHAFAAVGLWPEGQPESVGPVEVQVPVSSFPYQKPEQFLYRQVQAADAAAVPGNWPVWKTAFQARQARYEALLQEQSLSPSQRVEQTPAWTPAQQAAAEVGTLCHRTLQELLRQPTLSVTQALEQAASEAGLAPRRTEAAALLEPFCASPVFAQLKAQNLLASEMPFSYVTEQGWVENGVMDGVFELEDGTVWVVDYKTDQIPPGGVAELLEKYRPQLAVYAQAAQAIFPDRQVRCSAVLVRAFAVVDL